MEVEGIIQRGAVYEDNEKVTILETQRKITFFKNKKQYKVEPIVMSGDAGWSPTSRDDIGEYVSECFGILGMIQFLEGPYLIVIIDAEICGCIKGKHDVYSVRSKTLVPLYNTLSRMNAHEMYYCNMFNQFDMNNFYFSYSYNMCNSLQANYMYKQCTVDDASWLVMDTGVVTQKFMYNFVHLKKLGNYLGIAAEGFCLRVIHGYYGQTTVNLSGRDINGYVIARRSRFYAGTRYRRRGITASGHVANDVETEQMLEDSSYTGSIYSFIQVRGSTPTFWAQESTKTIVKKPPLTYPQHDPALTAPRKHVAELFSLYGVPIIMLNLLSDDMATDEGQLSSRYEAIVKAINAELPKHVHIHYIHRNIRSALERGHVRHMVTELIEHAWSQLGYFHLRNQNVLSIQTGVLRTSCLDCLDRTSVVTMQLGLYVFQKQLAMLGVHVQNREGTEESVLTCDDVSPSQQELFGYSQVLEPLLELFKAMFDSMGDALAMQYAGSRALRKYQGATSAFSRSLQLITTLKRRYSSHFTDADRQTLSNLFMGVLKPDRHPPPWYIDVDKYVSHERFQCEYANLEYWVIPLMCFLKRVLKLKLEASLPWSSLFDETGEYKLWVAMATLLAEHKQNYCIGQFVQDCNRDAATEKAEMEASVTVTNPTFSIEEVQLDNLAKSSSNDEYIELQRYTCAKTVYITRIDHDDINQQGLRSSRDHCSQGDALTCPTQIVHVPRLLGIKAPNRDRIMVSLEPWRIKPSFTKVTCLNVAAIKSRESDLNCYIKFVKPWV
ncbi:hypothetical protein BaOVIS_014590 [Babesia ovis]|uniref:SAC domain-containing protein n=1 Tax=Babesia ovis TaxID=5869 RepID=A0A9W5T9U6_BABOV|nr:hypothetical protein BaOVIS_014590 [Babesia ovis]